MPRRPSTTALLEALRDEAQAIIHAEHSQDLKLAEVARRIGTSPRQLERAFSDAGTTFRAALLTARVTHAADLLGNRIATVESVAKAVGYRQRSHFTKAFKRVHGQSPAEYRERIHGLRRVEPTQRRRAEYLQQRDEEDRARRERQAEAQDASRRWAEEIVRKAAQEGRSAFPASAFPEAL